MSERKVIPSPDTLRRIALLFPPESRDEVAALLTTQCGRNLPLFERTTEAAIERVQIAALKQSDGTMDGLIAAIELAQTDWRDLLVAAGFAEDVQAHKRWLADEPQAPNSSW